VIEISELSIEETAARIIAMVERRRERGSDPVANA
jgi:regulator of PEP synthase PpsR (kinase-PPPase family)